MRRSWGRVLAVVAVGVAAPIGSLVAAGPAAADPVGLTTIATAAGEDVACQVATIDVGTGALTPIGPVVEDAACPNDYAYAPDGRVYGVTVGFATGVSLLVIVDPVTGVQTPVGDVGFVAFDGAGLEFDAAGALWFYGPVIADDCVEPFSCLYRIDPATAAATVVGGIGDLEEPVEVSGMTRDCAGTLVASDVILPTVPTASAGDPPSPLADPNDVSGLQIEDESTLVTVDTATAGLSEIGPTGLVTPGLAFDGEGRLWGIGISSLTPPRDYSVVQIDPTTGVAASTVALALGEDQSLLGLTLGPTPDACPVAPIVLEPTFTG